MCPVVIVSSEWEAANARKRQMSASRKARTNYFGVLSPGRLGPVSIRTGPSWFVSTNRQSWPDHSADWNRVQAVKAGRAEPAVIGCGIPLSAGQTRPGEKAALCPAL